MQKLLYYDDQYLKEAEAEVLKIDGNKVLIDKTIFIPVSHTEPGDEGTINGIKVSGSEKLNGEIWHILVEEIDFKVGDVVKLDLDWKKRLLSMRLHSALHLLAGPFDKDFGKRAVAGAIKGEEANLVFKEIIDDEIIQKAFQKANQDIKNSLEIKSYWDKEREGFRWTQVGDYPAIPDGGLHIKNTKEIEAIVLKEKIDDGGKQKIVFQLKQMEGKKENNYAFIDGANLHRALKDLDQEMDYMRFRVWLSEKYKIKKVWQKNTKG